MKSTITLHILFFFMPYLFFACIKENSIVEDHYIHLSPSIDRSPNRVSGNDFEEGDRIGVYVVPYSADNTTPGTIWESDYAVNVAHIKTNNTWLDSSGGLLPWPGNRRIDVYAYYPYDLSLTAADPRTYAFTVQTDQSSSANYENSDFLWALSGGISVSANVPLTFHHRLSQVNIHLRSEISDASEWLDDAAVSITGVQSGSTINLADGSATIQNGTAVNIHPLRLGTPETDFDLSLTAVVPPQTINSGEQFLIVTLRGINYYYTPTQALSFSQGTATNFNITLTAQGIEVTVSQINEWDTGDTIDGNIGESLPRIVDLSSVDWNASRVHYIYNGTTIIGQVCWEYLFISGGVDIPAIVIYPLDTEGNVDLTRGFVAQVFNRTAVSNDQYTLNQNNVHGGSVAFGSDNTLSNYTAGTEALIEKVEIESASQITSALANTITTLTTSPYQLSDIDENHYPIVKIGTQYWIRENYRAENYTDGSSLIVYYYNNDRESYYDLYGGLYDWAVATDELFAPEGWHIPTYADWWSLRDYLAPAPATKLKRAYQWNSLSNANNVTGFSALPGGRRINTGSFSELNSYGQWWSSLSNTTSDAWRVWIGSGETAIGSGNLNKGYTQSVRLLRDN